MNATRFLLHSLSLALVFLLVPALAQAESVPAKVVSVKGAATALLPSGKSEKLAEGMMLPIGSTVTTGADGSVGIELVPGATTVVGPDSKMQIKGLTYTKDAAGDKKREVQLGLTQGSIFSSLAKNDGKSDFRIITPKGVAAARGTDWSVTVNGTTVTVAVVDGVVVITLPNGSTIRIPGKKVGVSTGNGGGLTYVIDDLSDADIAKIITAIEDAGFHLSETGVTPGSNYTDQGNQGTANPANISITPVQSPNQ